jgi:threonine dehydrogenase-like Zn-dependent dehydrogenase
VAGTAIHAVNGSPRTPPRGSTVGVIGFGGLGHLAVQLLRIYTAARIVVADTSPERVEWASRFGVDAAYESGYELAGAADAVLDLVGEHNVRPDPWAGRAGPLAVRNTPPTLQAEGESCTQNRTASPRPKSRAGAATTPKTATTGTRSST